MYVLAGDRAKQIAGSGVFAGNFGDRLRFRCTSRNRSLSPKFQIDVDNGALKLSYAPLA